MHMTGNIILKTEKLITIICDRNKIICFVHTVREVIEMNKKQQEKEEQQRNQNKFNCVTRKVKPENQNQTHNIRSEAVEPKNRQI